jgi:hypothetical protein
MKYYIFVEDCFYISWAQSGAGSSAGRLPPFGKVLEGVKADFIENMLVKAINRFSKIFSAFFFLTSILSFKTEIEV